MAVQRNTRFVNYLLCLLVIVVLTVGFFGASPRDANAVPAGMIEVFADDDLVIGTEYTEGDTLNLVIDDLLTVPSPDYSDSTEADGSGTVTFDLGGIYNILPGHVVSLQGPSSLKEHTVIDLRITTNDISDDLLSGTTDSTGNLSVYACETSGVICEWDYPTVDPGGNWTADFGADVIDWYSYGVAWQSDADGDRTGKNWSLRMPQMRVNMLHQVIQGWFFNPNIVVTLQIDDPLIPDPVDYTDSKTANGDGYLEIIVDSAFTLAAGQEVVLTDGNSTKEHTILDITVTGVDTWNEIVYGTGVNGGSINVQGFAKNELDQWVSSSVYAPVNSEGVWNADFSATSTVLDLDIGSWGYASQTDADYDATSINWWVEVPVNDYIDTPEIISTIPAAITQSTDLVGHDTDEPSFAACGQDVGLAAVWYKYEATTDGEMALDTMGSNYNTMLGVWQGAPGSLTLVSCNNDALGGVQSQLHFYYNAGTEYYIGVAQKGTVETGGEMKLHATTFVDVPGNNTHWRNVEGLYAQGVTGGCSLSPLSYCPNNGVTRQQMAVFLLRSMFGSDYVPPETTGIFTDVPLTSFYAPWIEELYRQGITGGCSVSPLNYCPTNIVTRQQMAVFLLRAKEGSVYTPPPATGVFTDVLASSFFAPWIEELYERGITGGCSTDPLMYCPANPVTRGQMGTFIVRMFEFPPLPVVITSP